MSALVDELRAELPERVHREVCRIRAAYLQTEGDSEDVITYAREVVALREELTTLQSRLEAVKAERDAILATSAAYNATEREGRAIMDAAAALARAEAAEAALDIDAFMEDVWTMARCSSPADRQYWAGSLRDRLSALKGEPGK
jgi:ATPase subunit of ABC transporter with duplicated ATPase domains